VAKTSQRSVNESRRCRRSPGAAPNPHNRTVLGFATKSGKAASPSRVEKHRRLCSRQYRFAIGKRNLHPLLLVVAMLGDEPGAQQFEVAVQDDPVRLMSTASYLEAAIVIETRFGEPGGRELDLWLHRAGVDLVGVDADQAEVARAAYRRHGDGRHRAGLSDGDCFFLRMGDDQRRAPLVQGK